MADEVGIRSAGESRSQAPLKRWFVAAAAPIVTLWILAVVIGLLISDNLAEAGQFGDMFGSINALFSGLALAGVVIAVLLQSRELALQREELAMTRGEVKLQRAQLERQATTSHMQRMETTFFQVLRRHAEIVGAMRFPTNNAIVGSACFRPFASELVRAFEKSPSDADFDARRAQAFKVLWEKYGGSFCSSFETLSVAVRLLATTDLFKNAFLRDSLVAQLADAELGLFLIYAESEIARSSIAGSAKDLDLTGAWKSRKSSDDAAKRLDEILGP